MHRVHILGTYALSFQIICSPRKSVETITLTQQRYHPFGYGTYELPRGKVLRLFNVHKFHINANNLVYADYIISTYRQHSIIAQNARYFYNHLHYCDLLNKRRIR